MKVWPIFAAAVLFAIIAAVVYPKVSPTGLSPTAATAKQAAQTRALEYARTEYDKAMRKLDADRPSIGDEAYRQGSIHEQALLDYRERIATNPIEEGCKTRMTLEGNVRTWDIVAACTQKYGQSIHGLGSVSSPIVVEVRYLSPDGDFLLEEPQLVAGDRASSVEWLGNHKWRIDGDVICNDTVLAGHHHVIRMTNLE